jgi:hypothetical protein
MYDVGIRGLLSSVTVPRLLVSTIWSGSTLCVGRLGNDPFRFAQVFGAEPDANRSGEQLGRY